MLLTISLNCVYGLEFCYVIYLEFNLGGQTALLCHVFQGYLKCHLTVHSQSRIQATALFFILYSFTVRI